MKFREIKDSTPLSEEDKEKLIPNLTTQEELNEFELQNIAAATLWARKSRKLKQDILSVSGLLLLHEKMFNDTWKWAGKFRTSQTSIGVDPLKIQNDLKILLDDVKFWLKHKTYSLDEIAIRFHHRLVMIHPFTNGNGRFSRLIVDFFLQFHDAEKFTWGVVKSLNEEGSVREEYIQALRKADKDFNDISSLLGFAKS